MKEINGTPPKGWSHVTPSPLHSFMTDRRMDEEGGHKLHPPLPVMMKMQGQVLRVHGLIIVLIFYLLGVYTAYSRA